VGYFWSSSPDNRPRWICGFRFVCQRPTRQAYLPAPDPGTADENGIAVENDEIKIEPAWSVFTRINLIEMVLLYRGKSGMIY